jgi:hypothetical protein
MITTIIQASLDQSREGTRDSFKKDAHRITIRDLLGRRKEQRQKAKR